MLDRCLGANDTLATVIHLKRDWKASNNCLTVESPTRFTCKLRKHSEDPVIEKLGLQYVYLQVLLNMYSLKLLRCHVNRFNELLHVTLDVTLVVVTSSENDKCTFQFNSRFLFPIMAI